MPIRVLVVDDSVFFRKRVKEILDTDSDITVIDTANNGQVAVEKAAALKPDVITMDIEMPVLDGISAVRKIMAQTPIPILMFSSLTHEGAQATLEALDAGAVDFLPKSFDEIAKDKEQVKQLLRARVKALGGRPARMKRPTPPPAPPSRPSPTQISRRVTPAPAVSKVTRKRPSRSSYNLVAIGTSTGGPVALQRVLTVLPANFPLPLLLIQHMPASFTPAFAQRLNALCQIEVREAKDGDMLKPGLALLAPGGKQMILERGSGAVARVKIVDGRPDMSYKPSVDLTFASVSETYPGRVLSVVMTGMGADGRDGARRLKAAGSTVWAQDEDSCVVYGMPMAVVTAGLADEVLSLEQIGPRLAGEV